MFLGCLAYYGKDCLHFVVKHLRFSRLGFGNKRLVEDIEDILADALELSLDLLTIVTNSSDVFVRALGLFFLLDRRDDPPRRTARSHYVLVGNRKQVSLIDGKLAANLARLDDSSCAEPVD